MKASSLKNNTHSYVCSNAKFIQEKKTFLFCFAAAFLSEKMQVFIMIANYYCSSRPSSTYITGKNPANK